MEEALKNDILVASGTGVIDTSKAICSTRGRGCVGGDVTRVFLDGVGEELVMFSLAAC